MTEWISNVNIPAAQLMIGMGAPLHAIPDLRRMHGRDVTGTDPIDFEADEERVAPAGHVVAVRITAGGWRWWWVCGEEGARQAGAGGAVSCSHARHSSRHPPPHCPAENANDGFKPTCGGIDEISFRSTPEVGSRGWVGQLRLVRPLDTGPAGCWWSSPPQLHSPPRPTAHTVPGQPGLGLLFGQGRRRDPRVLRLPVWPPVRQGRDARGGHPGHGGGAQGNQDPVRRLRTSGDWLAWGGWWGRLLAACWWPLKEIKCMCVPAQVRLQGRDLPPSWVVPLSH